MKNAKKSLRDVGHDEKSNIGTPSLRKGRKRIRQK